ncbi:hypothetical protein B0H10DRAFT_2059755 [Mycena sp. CBHHK59/15]|nr:hypothetical protein B0H10DRAFT_2059755 [Mycena sp. CBHHK59/15]
MYDRADKKKFPIVSISVPFLARTRSRGDSRDVSVKLRLHETVARLRRVTGSIFSKANARASPKRRRSRMKAKGIDPAKERRRETFS